MPFTLTPSEVVEAQTVSPSMKGVNQVGVTSDGTLWVAYRDSSYDVYVASKPPGGSWTKTLLQAGTYYGVALFVDNRDGVHVAALDGSGYHTLWFRSPTHNAWSGGEIVGVSASASNTFRKLSVFGWYDPTQGRFVTVAGSQYRRTVTSYNYSYRCRCNNQTSGGHSHTTCATGWGSYPSNCYCGGLCNGVGTHSHLSTDPNPFACCPYPQSPGTCGETYGYTYTTDHSHPCSSGSVDSYLVSSSTDYYARTQVVSAQWNDANPPSRYAEDFDETNLTTSSSSVYYGIGAVQADVPNLRGDASNPDLYLGVGYISTSQARSHRYALTSGATFSTEAIVDVTLPAAASDYGPVAGMWHPRLQRHYLAKFNGASVIGGYRNADDTQGTVPVLTLPQALDDMVFMWNQKLDTIVAVGIAATSGDLLVWTLADDGLSWNNDAQVLASGVVSTFGTWENLSVELVADGDFHVTWGWSDVNVAQVKVPAGGGGWGWVPLGGV